MRRLVLAALLAALAVPAGARAEPVPGTAGASDAVLAVAADGTPAVAALVDGGLVLADRGATGWTDEAAPALPGPDAILDAAAVAPDGSTWVLVQDAHGRWLVLDERSAAGWRAHLLVRRVPAGGSLGLAGLALDRSGRPAVAYVIAASVRKTWLRLVRLDARGRLVTRAVTRDGFPPSRTLPAAEPVVLPGGSVRVVETYDDAAIEWAPSRRTWEGQFLFGSTAGYPAGPVAALADAGGVWSAWTELYPSFGESHVLLTLHANGEQTTVLSTHADLVALALGPAGPEAAANDYAFADPSGATDDAGLVLTPTSQVELGGELLGYAVDAAGARQVLLAGPDGLEWDRSASAPSVHVSLTATPVAGRIALAGAVSGASGGTVELYREHANVPAVLVATVPLGADGSFAAGDSPPAGTFLYRAVYRAADGLPYGFLTRSPVTAG